MNSRPLLLTWFLRHAIASCLLAAVLEAAEQRPPASPALTDGTDRSAAMVAGIHRHLDTLTREIAAVRAVDWDAQRNRPTWSDFVRTMRGTVARQIGAHEARGSIAHLEVVVAPGSEGPVAESSGIRVHSVRWRVLGQVLAEGLLLEPRQTARVGLVVLPDAEQTPEQIAGLAPGLPPARHYARRLAESGCLVLVPTLLSRGDAQSGNPAIGRITHQPHREWIYRQAFALGYHPLGLEVQTVSAGLDALLARQPRLTLGVVGWGEGAAVALLSGALDPRVGATVVSGYFGPREQLSSEPIYRNVFGRLKTAGDAELAQLILPRTLIVEPAAAPVVPGPTTDPSTQTPGVIRTPSRIDVDREVVRARYLAGELGNALKVTSPVAAASPDFCSEETLSTFLAALDSAATLAPAAEALTDRRYRFSPEARQGRIVRGWQDFLQAQIAVSRTIREERFWKKVSADRPSAWAEAMRPFRESFASEVIGRLPPSDQPLNARSWLLFEKPGWIAHEVVLDVAPDVFAWGYLLQPKGLAPNELRPVVVAQHGLEGLPADLLDENPSTRAFATYQAFAVRLVERGFIVFVPHNPYRGPDFRALQRKAHPLGLSLFSFIAAQHERILDWLATLPHVDALRIGFYGLSYGGSTAMRIPALLPRYAVTVCSGNFNEWVWKLSTTEWGGSYVFTREYEMPEFNLGGTFNHAEMAALIAPRPFMVERGHVDPVGTDEWVSFEYAKVRRLYDRLGIPESTAIEYFNGPHTIHGVGTYAFLHRHLGWPEPTRR
jgi:dienelactone hydrolase